VNRVVPAAELMSVTEALLRQILANAPLALSRILTAPPRRRCAHDGDALRNVASARWRALRTHARARRRSSTSARLASAGADGRA
jgi:hypothetical protein